MNCHYCTYPIGDDDPYLTVGTRLVADEELQIFRGPRWSQRFAHLACALANVNTVEGRPDKSGKWCDYYHQPTGKWCMLPPHGDDVEHVLEDGM